MPEPEPRRRRADAHQPPARRRRSRPRRRRRVPWRLLVRGLVAVVVLAAVGLAGAWAVAALRDGGDGAPDDPGPTTAATDTATDAQPTLVLATFDETDPDGAELVMLLATHPDTGRGTIVLVPASVVADVPGEGLFQLGATFRAGQAPLLELTLANLMGVDLDAAAAISTQGWSSLFTRLDGLALTVPEQLVQVEEGGERTIRFQPGEQRLDGPRVAEYLTFREQGETEVQRLPRVQQVLEALLDRIEEDPAVLDTLFEDGAPMIDVGDAAQVRQILAGLAGARAAGMLEVRTLPVNAIGSGDEASYRVEEDRLTALVEDRFAPSIPRDDGATGRRLQVLNGNGTPGIGSQVAERLQPGGFRLVETGNAADFGVPTTRIIVYDDDPDQVAIAREAQELLGVGEVEVSEVPVSVVDLTIIVGQDFP